jgi:hypothetical protein
MLGAARRTVAGWIDSGKLKGYRIPGSKDRRTHEEWVNEFCDEHGIPRPPTYGIFALYVGDHNDFFAGVKCMEACGLQSRIVRPEDAIESIETMRPQHVFLEAGKVGDMRMRTIRRRFGKVATLHEACMG